jgi:anti-sigma factor RsiW
MGCREAAELVTAYMEAALPPHARLVFEGHLAACASCTACLEGIRDTVAMLGRLPPEENIDPRARAALIRGFRDWRRR